MSKRTIIELIVGIVLIGLFLISWLVFKNIKSSDWIALLIGVVNLGLFVYYFKKDRK